MTNPFSQFAAASSGSGGWMTTKKRGRDDAQIAKDARAAVEARKRRRNSNNKKNTKTKPSRNKKKVVKQESLDSFIVNDDDDDEETFESEESFSEEEVEVLQHSRPRKPLVAAAAAACRPKQQQQQPSSSSSDDESDEDEPTTSFFGTYKKRTSRPPPPNHKKKLIKNRFSEEKKDNDYDSSDDSSLSEELEVVMGKKPLAAFAPTTTTSRFFDSSSCGQPTTTKQQPRLKKNLAFSTFSSDDDEQLTSPPPAVAAPRSTAKKVDNNRNSSLLLNYDDDDSSDEDDSWEKPIFSTKHNQKSVSTATSFNNNDNNDVPSDDDEAFALALALSQSQQQSSTPSPPPRRTHQKKKNRLKKLKKHSKKTKTKKKKKTKVVVDLSPTSVEEEDEPIVLMDSSDEEDNDDDEEVDVYVDDEDAREARSVLAAANTLSAQVLRTMKEWCSNNSSSGQNYDVAAGSSGSNNNSAVVPQGMIVDGALAMSASNDSTTASSSSSWISQEQLRGIVSPELKLADYQLIGVNWLALLHNMTCNVEGGTKENTTNVNGVLADEMGLGKTVQTIAFLAWLKKQNNNGGMEERPVGGKSEVLEVKSDDDSTVQDGDGPERAIELQDDDSNECDDLRGDNHSKSDSRAVNHRPHIIIVPASVLSNWQREFEKFCPSMVVVKYHGSMAERGDIQDRLRRSLPGRGRRLPLDVVLTTFSYFSSEKADDRSFLRKFRFDYMVVDEAHCLKNPRGTRYRNLNKFSTSHRLLLTGTPVQNSPKELMSLLCFLMPLFSRSTGGDADFDGNSKDDLGGENMLQHFVTESSSGEGSSSRDANASAYKKLKQLFAPFVLRRRKVNVLNQLIPPKTRKLELVPFDDKTRTVYDSIIAAHVNRKENSSAVDSSYQQHLFTALRKAANHPLLLRTRHKSEEAIEHLSKHLFQFGYFGRDATCTQKLVRKELESFSDFDVHCAALELMDENPCRHDILSRYTLGEEDLFSSPKFVRLRQILPDLIENNHRVLMFSQWTRCLDLIGCLMDCMQLEYLRLDGSTAIEERQKLIDKFNHDSSIPVFLLSTRAGGMGINLTAADTCILHDLDFNPFNDIQAEDRCHRIGQTKPVTVIKMITAGTVDADIYEMQQRKAKMNAAILENDSSTEDEAAGGDTAAKSKKKDEEEIDNILQSALNRFLFSPGRQDSNSKEGTLI